MGSLSLYKKNEIFYILFVFDTVDGEGEKDGKGHIFTEPQYFSQLMTQGPVINESLFYQEFYSLNKETGEYIFDGSYGNLTPPSYEANYDGTGNIVSCIPFDNSYSGEGGQEEPCEIEEIDFLQGMVFDEVLFSEIKGGWINFKETNGNISEIKLDENDVVQITPIVEDGIEMTVNGITFKERGVIKHWGHSSYYGIEENTNNLYTWGSNSSGETGQGHTNEIANPQILLEDIKQILTTGNATFVVDNGGNLFSWGGASQSSPYGNYGVLGNGTIDTMIIDPYKIWDGSSGDGIDKLFGFSESLYAVKTNGDMIAWGKNSFSDGSKKGLLGIGSDKIYQDTPTVIDLEGKTVKDMFFVVGETYFIMDTGEVYATGYNNGFRLGTGSGDINVLSPEKMLNMTNIISMQRNNSDYNNIIALDSNKDMWIWGEAKQESWLSGTNPQKISSVYSEIKNIKSVKGDFILREDGSVWSWTNRNYNFGHTEPTKVLEDVESLFYRDDYFAIKETGKLWGWGKNSYWGLLTKNNVLNPIQLGIVERCRD
jgi:alpha-tubulin suppressor-like RCC1 family protein